MWGRVIYFRVVPFVYRQNFWFVSLEAARDLCHIDRVFLEKY